MAVPIATPNMGLVLPTVGQSQTFADTLTADWVIINDHDHSAIGKALEESSIDWTQGFDGANFPLVDASYLSFVPQTIQSTINNTLYFYTDTFGTDLWYRDGLGNQIRLTINGHMNNITLVAGFTGDFKTFNASVTYVNSSTLYTFSSARGLASIAASAIDLSAGTSLVVANTYNSQQTVDFNVNSEKMFAANSLVFFNNYYAITTPNFTVLSTISQAINNNTNRPVRYKIPELNVAKTVEILLDRPAAEPITVTFTQGSIYRPGGNSSTLYFSAQDGYTWGGDYSARAQEAGMGTIFGVVPTYNVFDPIANVTVDLITFELKLPTSLTSSPYFIERMPQLCIMRDGVPAIFVERITKYNNNGSTTGSFFFCQYVLQVNVGQTKVSDYFVIIRI